MLICFSVVIISQCTCIANHHAVHLKHTYSFICQLYHNKDTKKFQSHLKLHCWCSEFSPTPVVGSPMKWGRPSRLRRSKTWRSASSPQIYQKYIYMWNNSYITPTEIWQKTSDFPKGKKRPCTWCVVDRVLVLRPGVRPVLLRWESRVQDIGLPETSWLHVISNSESTPRDLHLNAKTQLHSITSKL